jgi:hypothetical protein
VLLIAVGHDLGEALDHLRLAMLLGPEQQQPVVAAAWGAVALPVRAASVATCAGCKR